MFGRGRIRPKSDRKHVGESQRQAVLRAVEAGCGGVGDYTERPEVSVLSGVEAEAELGRT
jgi:hypothetical protein